MSFNGSAYSNYNINSNSGEIESLMRHSGEPNNMYQHAAQAWKMERIYLGNQKNYDNRMQGRGSGNGDQSYNLDDKNIGIRSKELELERIPA